MPIADFKPTRTTIEFDGGSFEVRAISLSDAAIIVEIHQDVIDTMYLKLAEHGVGSEDDFTAQLAAEITIELVRESPGLAARIIALAADESDQVSNVLKMPFPVQIEALKQIGILTFKDIAGAKKFAADVIELIRGIRPTATETAVTADAA